MFTFILIGLISGMFRFTLTFVYSNGLVVSLRCGRHQEAVRTQVAVGGSETPTSWTTFEICLAQLNGDRTDRMGVDHPKVFPGDRQRTAGRPQRDCRNLKQLTQRRVRASLFQLEHL